MRKEKRDQALKKKQVEEYKAKKEVTKDLLANADLPGMDDDDDYSEDNYSEDDQLQSQSKDTGAYLDNMLAQYANKAKRPPAVI